MTSTAFGWVKYNDKMHQEDILILGDGSVMRRNADEVMRKYGTMKAIDVEEMSLLLGSDPEIIVVGTGQSDSLRIPAEVMAMLDKSNARLVQGVSPKAVKYFDSLTCRKAALIHVK